MGKCKAILETGLSCGKKGPWGYVRGTHCTSHKLEGMTVRQKTHCDICGKAAIYGFDSVSQRKCKVHIDPGMVDLHHKKCVLCSVRPNFGDPNDGVPLFCKKHIPEDKVDVYCDVISKKCLSCSKTPTFGDPENKIAVVCKEHIPEDKKDIYIDVKHRKCRSCVKRACFGQKEQNIPIFCSQHIPDDTYIDVVHNKCLHCQRRPTFGDPVEKIALYCKDHIPKEKADIYDDVVNKRCFKCVKFPSFGDPADRIRVCCKQHIPEDKLGIFILLDKRKCIKCSKQPSFGDPENGVKICCKQHIPEDKKGIYVSLNGKLCERCDTRASFGDPVNNIKICCKRHIPEDKKNVYVLLTKRACRSNFPPFDNICPTRIDIVENPYDDFCSRCFRYYYPTDPRSSQGRFLSKEHRVATYIGQFHNMFIHDKPLLYGDCPCPQKRRIDLRMLIEGTLLCIEIDENQHRNYNQEEEIVRYNDLMAYHTGRMIFIRYNPDRFRNEAGVIQNPSFEDRMKRLLQEIEHQIERIKSGANIREDKLIEVVYLFYNANKPQSLKDLEDDILFHEDVEDGDYEEEKEGIYHLPGPSVISTGSPTDDEDCIYIPVNEEIIRRYIQSPQKEAVIVLED